MIWSLKVSLRLLVFLLPLASSCTLLPGNRVPSERSERPTQLDSVSQTAMSLFRIVREIDAEGREIEALPSWLSDAGTTQRRSLTDTWGRPLHIQVRGPIFEIHSAGPDGSHGTPDDISAIGKLGRVLPCEIRSFQHVARFEDVAPLCDETPPDTIYPLCEALMRSGVAQGSGPQLDSVAEEGEHLVRAAWIVEGAGRELSIPPLALRNVPLPRQNTRRELVDSWGSVVRYTRQGSTFELRSAGPDRAFDSEDDIIVRRVLGTAVQCSFRVGDEPRSCSVPPPLCQSIGTR